MGMQFKVDEKTQTMLKEIARAKQELEIRMQMIFQVLRNTLGVPDNLKVEISPDFITLTIQDDPSRPVPELSTGPLKDLKEEDHT